MPTQYIHRLLIAVPAARQAAVNAWIAANIDPPPAGPWFDAGLSATGNPPATAYWTNAALTPPQLKLWMVRLCQDAGIAQPAGWDGWTRQERRQWFQDQRQAIRQATGIRFTLADNDGAWDSPEQLLAAAGLQVVGG